MGRPLAELGFDGVDYRFQLIEIAVVQAETPCELPNSFDGIQIRRVGRQIVQRKVKQVFFSPWPMKKGMMVFGVIGNHHHPAASADAVARRLFMNAKKLALLNLPVSRQNRNFPSRSRTAPK